MCIQIHDTLFSLTCGITIFLCFMVFIVGVFISENVMIYFFIIRNVISVFFLQNLYMQLI